MDGSPKENRISSVPFFVTYFTLLQENGLQILISSFPLFTWLIITEQINLYLEDCQISFVLVNVKNKYGNKQREI